MGPTEQVGELPWSPQEPDIIHLLTIDSFSTREAPQRSTESLGSEVHHFLLPLNLVSSAVKWVDTSQALCDG